MLHTLSHSKTIITHKHMSNQKEEGGEGKEGEEEKEGREEMGGLLKSSAAGRSNRCFVTWPLGERKACDF